MSYSHPVLYPPVNVVYVKHYIPSKKDEHFQAAVNTMDLIQCEISLPPPASGMNKYSKIHTIAHAI